MRKTYQKPYIDILHVDVENLLAGSGGGGKTIDRDGNPNAVPGGGGSPSTNMDDLEDGAATAKGGSLWDDWE